MRIRWSQPAVNDLTGICEYLAQHESQILARRVASVVYDAVQLLGRFPERARSGREPGTRELVIQRYPYIVVYESRARAVDILRVLHSSQQWP